MAETVASPEIRRILAGEGHEPLSEMALSKFIADGMPKAGRGKYDPETCTFWYLGRLRTSVKRKASESKDGNVLTLDEAQRRLTTVKAESEEMSLAERRGELIPISLHEAMLTSIVQVTKQRILNIPTRLGPSWSIAPWSRSKPCSTPPERRFDRNVPCEASVDGACTKTEEALEKDSFAPRCFGICVHERNT